ncbi:MAG: response regulator [Gemmobacter sp.]|nr:response regulator [Gemmobacter sp.]
MTPDGNAHAPRGEGAEDAALALLGHDIRAALSDVIGGLRLIDADKVDAATRLQLDRMRAAGELLARLMEEGLATMLGENAQAHPANVQLPRLLRDVQMRWSARARDKGLEFVLSELGDLPPVITVDRIGLERALSNLLSNAIKYTDEGRVQMSVYRTESGALMFDVCDDGPGFSDAALAKLFRYSGRPSGMEKPGEGLGLHIANEMAGRAGGDLSVVNRPDGGAQVKLSLPASTCQPALDMLPDVDDDTVNVLPDLRRIRVLVAEDSPTNQQLIRAMLQRLGAEVDVASDGIEAVTALEQENFDLALIDIEMPRLNGIDVIRSLRGLGGRQGRIPVLAVTAYVLRANREAIYASGADAILAKPLGSIEAFGAAIARVLARSMDAPPPEDIPALGDDAPVMVLSHFERLMEVAGPESGPELLRRLQEDLRHVERRTVAALSDPDWSELRSQTHVLIALAGAVGAQRLQHCAESLNAAAHRRDGQELDRRAPQMMSLLDDLIHFVSQRILESHT